MAKDWEVVDLIFQESLLVTTAAAPGIGAVTGGFKKQNGAGERGDQRKPPRNVAEFAF